MNIASSPLEFSLDHIALIRQRCCKNFSDDEVKFVLHTSKRLELDPLANQIYFTLRISKTGERTIQVTVGIDGYRLIADRTKAYAGSDDPIFDNEDNIHKATVTVYKIVGGIRCPFTASARWEQYYPGDSKGTMWKKMPHLMLGKCAEALALRKAFPAELSGVYTPEEMEQIEIASEDNTPPPPAAKIIPTPKPVPVEKSKPPLAFDLIEETVVNIPGKDPYKQNGKTFEQLGPKTIQGLVKFWEPRHRASHKGEIDKTDKIGFFVHMGNLYLDSLESKSNEPPAHTDDDILNPFNT